MKLYLEKLYCNICDGNSPLENSFAITVVVVLKLPYCLPWQQGPACQQNMIQEMKCECKGISEDSGVSHQCYADAVMCGHLPCLLK